MKYSKVAYYDISIFYRYIIYITAKTIVLVCMCASLNF